MELPRARRSDRTKGQLTSALTGLVFAKGFENVSVRDITTRAGVARSTFYEHFSSKEDVLRAAMNHLFVVVADCVAVAEQPPRLVDVLDHLWSNRRLTDGIFSGHARTVLYRNQTDLIEQRLRLMPEDFALPPRLVAVHLAEAQLALIESWLRGRAHCPSEQLAASLYRSSRAIVLAMMA